MSLVAKIEPADPAPMMIVSYFKNTSSIQNHSWLEKKIIVFYPRVSKMLVTLGLPWQGEDVDRCANSEYQSPKTVQEPGGDLHISAKNPRLYAVSDWTTAGTI